MQNAFNAGILRRQKDVIKRSKEAAKSWKHCKHKGKERKNSKSYKMLCFVYDGV